MKKRLGNKKEFWLKAGLVVGIVAVLIGLYFVMTYRDTVFYGSASSASGGTVNLGTAKFGADFYTEIYKSATFAGNAVKGVYELLGMAFGVLFILIGAIDVCVFGVKLADCKEKQAAALEEETAQQLQGARRSQPLY